LENLEKLELFEENNELSIWITDVGKNKYPESTLGNVCHRRVILTSKVK
jgi:hypothetical protein